MSAANGHIHANGAERASSAMPPASTFPIFAEFTREQFHTLVSELEVPFDPVVIEWRVTNTTKDKARGQIVPYADQRSYSDRLNRLFTPAGWTRRYSVHTSPNFERSKDKKIVAKVFVTCELTIHGIGSHSATGEEWADDDNAGTSAEAQAFKRACSCFGLGRYLYYFSGAWVDLDDRKRPLERPVLFGWATPEGWRQGLRPSQANIDNGETTTDSDNAASPKTGTARSSAAQLAGEIEKMEEVLGRSMYRGLLRLARAWKPSQITDVAMLRKTLDRMQAAERGFRRLEAALERVTEATAMSILKALKIATVERIDSLEVLHKLVLAMEAAASR
jgi:hypothetical protein